MIFLLFDIEVAFLYPWAMAIRDLRWLGFVQVLVFCLLPSIYIALATEGHGDEHAHASGHGDDGDRRNTRVPVDEALDHRGAALVGRRVLCVSRPRRCVPPHATNVVPEKERARRSLALKVVDIHRTAMYKTSTYGHE
jgi:hypothetical protein